MFNLILIILGLRPPTINTALKGLMIAEKQLRDIAAAAEKEADAQVDAVLRAQDVYAKKVAKLADRCGVTVGRAAIKQENARNDAARATRVAAKLTDLTA